MASDNPLALAATMADLYRATVAATPGTDGPALSLYTVNFDSNTDTGRAQVTLKSGQVLTGTAPPNGSIIFAALDGPGGMIVLVEASSDNADGSAYGAATRAANP